MIDIVNGLLLADDTVLMAQRAENRANYPNTWSFPGGHVETGETLDQAIRREMVEEIGVTIKDASLLDFSTTIAGRNGLITFHFFTVKSWTGMPENLGTEHSEIRWVALQDAGQMPRLALKDYATLFERLQAL